MPTSEPRDDPESLVRAAVDRLVADGGQLWGCSHSPRWILADDDVWWLTEPVADATRSGRLWRVPPDPALGLGSTAARWQDRNWAMVDCVSAPPTVRELLHEAFHAFWQPGAWDWVTTTVDDGDDSLASPSARAALRVELRAWAQGLKSDDREDLMAAGVIRRWRLGMLGDEERSRQLDASQGAIVTADWKWVGLPSPTPPAGTSEVIEGPGWVLSISDPSLGTEIVWSSRPPD